MKTYIAVVSFYYKRYLIYPYETITIVIKRFFNISFLLIFWNLILQGSTINGFNLNNLLSYFLISDGVGELLMSDDTKLGRLIRKQVKSGNINQILIKPVSIIKYYYFLCFGQSSIKNIIAIISIVIGVIINHNLTLSSFLIFLIFMFNGFFVALSFNIFEGALSLIFTEVNGIKNAINHVTRVLSGAFIPLTLFPEGFRKIIELTPFPTMVFGPTNALRSSQFNIEIIKQIIVGLFWSLVLFVLVNKFWNYCLKKYEAIGI